MQQRGVPKLSARTIILLSMVSVVIISIMFSGAYTTLVADRPSSLNVSDDSTSGILQIQNSTQLISGTDNQELITVTNPTEQSQDVTVNLNGAYDWSISSTGTLTRTVTVAPGDSEVISVDVGPSAQTGTYEYTVNSVSMGGFTFTQSRTATVQNTSGFGTVFEDFEACNLGNYTVNGGGTANIEPTTTYEGSCSGRIENGGGNSLTGVYDTTSGLHDTQNGTTYTGFVRGESTNIDAIGYVIGAQQDNVGLSDGYVAQLDYRDGQLELVEVVGGTPTVLSSTPISISTGTYYKLELVWRTDGTLVLTAYDLSDNQLASAGATSTTYTSGGFGFLLESRAGGTKVGYFDYVTTSPATTQTLSITENSPLQSDSSNQQLVTIENIASNPQDVTIQLDSSYPWTFTDGSTSKSFTLNPGQVVSYSVDIDPVYPTQDFRYNIIASEGGTVTQFDENRPTVIQSNLRWSTQADWDNRQSESRVVHEQLDGSSVPDHVRLGYNSTEPDLLLYYPFDDAAGNAIDASGNNRDGVTSQVTTGATGIFGQSAYDFNGRSTVEETGAGAYLNGLSEWTVTFWIQSDAVGVDNGVFTTQDPQGGGGGPPGGGGGGGTPDDVLGVRYDAAGTVGSCTNCITVNNNVDNTPQVAESTSNVQTTNWQFVAVTWSSTDDGNLDIYVNGVEQTPSANTGPENGLVTQVNTLILGKGTQDTKNNDGWDGRIDEFRVYGTELNSERVSDMDTTADNGTLLTASKSFNRPTTVELRNLDYALNTGVIQVEVIGSPGTASQETQIISLTGASTYPISWSNAHTTYEIRMLFESTSVTESPYVSTIELVPT